MLKAYVMSGAIALALVLPAGVRAQTNPQLEEIRKQIQELKDSYDARIQALEKQLKAAEGAQRRPRTPPPRRRALPARRSKVRRRRRRRRV